MGLETICKAVLDGQPSQSKALLETTELVFRGPPRVAMLLSAITSAKAEDGWLVLSDEQHTLKLELGAAAPKWLDKIKNPKSVLDKLGVKPDQKVLAIEVPDAAFLEQLAAKVKDVAVAKAARGGRKDNDVVLLGLTAEKDLARIEDAKARIRPDGAVWLIRPKGSKALAESSVRAAGKAAGLVDVKVVGFSASHTADKFVIPLKNRK